MKNGEDKPIKTNTNRERERQRYMTKSRIWMPYRKQESWDFDEQS